MPLLLVQALLCVVGEGSTRPQSKQRALAAPDVPRRPPPRRRQLTW